jgi:hypothetical protein
VVVAVPVVISESHNLLFAAGDPDAAETSLLLGSGVMTAIDSRTKSSYFV